MTLLLLQERHIVEQVVQKGKKNISVKVGLTGLLSETVLQIKCTDVQ